MRQNTFLQEINSANAVRNAQGRKRATMTPAQQAAHEAAKANVAAIMQRRIEEGSLPAIVMERMRRAAQQAK